MSQNNIRTHIQTQHGKAVKSTVLKTIYPLKYGMFSTWKISVLGLFVTRPFLLSISENSANYIFLLFPVAKLYE